MGLLDSVSKIKSNINQARSGVSSVRREISNVTGQINEVQSVFKDVRNVINDVGAISGQLKSSFSAIENTQIQVMNEIGAGISKVAGGIVGDVSDAISSITGATKGAASQAAAAAEALTSTGNTAKTAAAVAANNIAPANAEKKAVNGAKAAGYRPTGAAADPGGRGTITAPAIETPQAAMEYKRGGNQPKTFPQDLTEKALSWLQLKFEKYERPVPYNPGNIAGETSIYLPIPDNFEQGFSVRIDNQDLDGVGDLIKSGAGTTLINGDYSTFAKTTETLNRAIGEFKPGEGSAALARQGIRTAQGFSELLGADGSIIQTGLAASGQIPNPHPTVFFKGMNLRSFTWQWKLVPRNDEEAWNISEILWEMKKKILPNRKGNWLEQPWFVTPIIQGAAEDTMGKFKRSLVSNLNINYTGEGTSAFFYDGYPVSIILGMEFTEVETFAANDVEV